MTTDYNMGCGPCGPCVCRLIMGQKPTHDFVIDSCTDYKTVKPTLSCCLIMHGHIDKKYNRPNDVTIA